MYGATIEPNEPVFYGSTIANTLWFRYVTPSPWDPAYPLEITAAIASGQTSVACTLIDVLALSSPSQSGSMAQLTSVSGISAASDQQCPSYPSRSCVLAWPAAPGDVLYIRVGGCSSTAAVNSGIVELYWEQLASKKR
jgi:hypothetical protein